jgi:hypothetical protein
MQVSATFPELSSGQKKTKRKSARVLEPTSDINSTMMQGRFPRKTTAPKSLESRRKVAHAKGQAARRG